MRFFTYLTIAFLTLCFNVANAQTYIVTSNADSGPGTLREALTLASDINRTTPVVINFNLPGAGSINANRTIRLKTALPIVTSNLIIDGSSQASWSALGVSGAKIILEPEYPNSTFSGLTIGSYSATNQQTSNVEIYGLNIRNFASITNLQTVNTSQGSGIVIDYRANNIIIGAPGKGNVIGGNINGILIQNNYYYANNTATKIKIQSNLIGLLYDGITANTNVTGISANLYDCGLDLGGDNAGEGNVIAANRINVDINRSNYTTARFDVNVINNKIGVDYTGQKDFHDLPIFLSSSSLEIAGLKINAQNTALYVRNNVIGGNRTSGVSITNADFILTGNSIGTDVGGSINMGNGIGIKIESNATGTIGGPTDAEKNVIANNNYGIETVSAKPVKITQNSMYCNKVFGIGKTLAILQPFIQILKKNPNYVSGKATPNSEVELFYTSNCQGICEGKTYIATVRAGTDGRWIYNGAISGLVTATASLLNATTSPFSTAELPANEAIVEPVTCNNNGSITIDEPREGFTFSWVKIETDGTRLPMGNTQSISNLVVGTYEVTIDDGCKAFATVFIIKDQILTKPTIVPPTIACAQTSFTFTAQTLRGKGTIKYTWINNSTGATVATTNPASLPEGTYFVRALDEAGCTMDSDPLTINRKPQPKITNTPTITAAACGKINGAIKGILISDATGILSYKWFYRNPTTGILGTTEVANTLDLENVSGGNYVLFIYDQGQCSPVQQSYNIPIYNTVAISQGSITPARCGNNNGIIDLVTITDADTYEWFAPDGTSIKKGTYSAGISIKIIDLAPGTYTLKASNTLSSCTLSRTFTVNAAPPTIFTYNEIKNNATCGLINGEITLNFTSVFPTKYEWRDESGTIIPATRAGSTISIKNLPPGNYRLLVEDVNSCPAVIGPFTVELIPVLNIVVNTGKVANDGCSLKRGSITGIKVIGGVPDYDFKWINDKGEAVQYNLDLVNAVAGTYKLEVRDKTSCGYAISEAYTIEDIPFKIEAPVVNDIRVCYVSDITLPIVGPEEGTYQIFADLEDSKPLYVSNNGIFNFKVAKSADYYVRRQLGSCLSEFTKVHIEVTHDNLEIMNTMTPNGDGLNDTWLIKGLPDFKGTNIKVYSRAGQLVYESIGNYTKPFNGIFRGAELPAGVYYFVIDLRAECKPIAGSLTLLR